ncbi:hypothetical protein MEQU1_000923 [Malassezia equina]|uniref:Uncharacterized protein n=1 Tax=Malassezia equina TaxID=1381935 RepID=A0AAF0E9J1_9BASI|nr:hypothetical protein MEQU1_000923 [Malassezia equina]
MTNGGIEGVPMEQLLQELPLEDSNLVPLNVGPADDDQPYLDHIYKRIGKDKIVSEILSGSDFHRKERNIQLVNLDAEEL